MRLSHGARRLSGLLQWYARKYPTVYLSVAKMAKHLEVCARTVKRWLAELRVSKQLSIAYHGPRGGVYCYKNVPDVPDVPDCVPDCVPDRPSHLYITSTVQHFPQTPAQSAPNPKTLWPTRTTEYFTGRPRAHSESVARPRSPLAPADRKLYQEAREVFPMLGHERLLECVVARKAGDDCGVSAWRIERKPPSIEVGKIKILEWRSV